MHYYPSVHHKLLLFHKTDVHGLVAFGPVGEEKMGWSGEKGEISWSRYLWTSCGGVQGVVDGGRTAPAVHSSNLN